MGHDMEYVVTSKGKKEVLKLDRSLGVVGGLEDA